MRSSSWYGMRFLQAAHLIFERLIPHPRTGPLARSRRRCSRLASVATRPIRTNSTNRVVVFVVGIAFCRVSGVSGRVSPLTVLEELAVSKHRPHEVLDVVVL